jgi:phosphoglycerol transferase
MINSRPNIYFRFIIILLFTFILSLLFYRNYSLYPSVMGDEYINSIFSKNTNFKDMLIPSYVYFYFYKISYVCDSDYLNCARILNLLFFVFGIFFIYLLSIKFANRNTSKIIFILLLLSPFNVYTAYFIAESMFFCFIWLTFYLTFTLTINKYYYFFIGFLLSICSLIKPHAIFFIPVFVVYFYVLKKNISKTLLNCSYFILSFFFIKLIISILTDVEFSIFGEYYNKDTRRYIEITFSDLVLILKYSIINLFGIASFLLIVFSLPILILIQNSIIYFKKLKHDYFDSFSIFVLIIFTFITIIYSVFNGFSANYHMLEKLDESPFRINNRYYFFIFPLLLIIFLKEFSIMKKKKIKSKLIKIVSIIFILTLVYFSMNFYESYHLVDAPFYRGLTYNKNFFYLSVVFSILLIILYNYKKKESLRIYLFIFLPIIFIISSIPINKEILFYKTPTKSNQIGNYLNEYFKSKNNDSFLIINIDENKVEPLDKFKLIMSFDKKNIAITEIKSSLISEDNINKDLIHKYSKKKYWERNINTIKYNHNILIINKINELTIFYMESNTNLIKRIY